jgi:hypothetical protein
MQTITITPAEMTTLNTETLFLTQLDLQDYQNAQSITLHEDGVTEVEYSGTHTRLFGLDGTPTWCIGDRQDFEVLKRMIANEFDGDFNA